MSPAEYLAEILEDLIDEHALTTRHPILENRVVGVEKVNTDLFVFFANGSVVQVRLRAV